MLVSISNVSVGRETSSTEQLERLLTVLDGRALDPRLVIGTSPNVATAQNRNLFPTFQCSCLFGCTRVISLNHAAFHAWIVFITVKQMFDIVVWIRRMAATYCQA
jgi:hypothetical protein